MYVFFPLPKCIPLTRQHSSRRQLICLMSIWNSAPQILPSAPRSCVQGKYKPDTKCTALQPAIRLPPTTELCTLSGVWRSSVINTPPSEQAGDGKPMTTCTQMPHTAVESLTSPSTEKLTTLCFAPVRLRTWDRYHVCTVFLIDVCRAHPETEPTHSGSSASASMRLHSRAVAGPRHNP